MLTLSFEGLILTLAIGATQNNTNNTGSTITAVIAFIEKGGTTALLFCVILALVFLFWKTKSKESSTDEIAVIQEKAADIKNTAEKCLDLLHWLEVVHNKPDNCGGMVWYNNPNSQQVIEVFARNTGALIELTKKQQSEIRELVSLLDKYTKQVEETSQAVCKNNELTGQLIQICLQKETLSQKGGHNVQ